MKALIKFGFGFPAITPAGHKLFTILHFVFGEGAFQIGLLGLRITIVRAKLKIGSNENPIH